MVLSLLLPFLPETVVADRSVPRYHFRIWTVWKQPRRALAKHHLIWRVSNFFGKLLVEDLFLVGFDPPVRDFLNEILYHNLQFVIVMSIIIRRTVLQQSSKLSSDALQFRITTRRVRRIQIFSFLLCVLSRAVENLVSFVAVACSNLAIATVLVDAFP
jgi:hypothetical protein